MCKGTMPWRFRTWQITDIMHRDPGVKRLWVHAPKLHACSLPVSAAESRKRCRCCNSACTWAPGCGVAVHQPRPAMRATLTCETGCAHRSALHQCQLTCRQRACRPRSRLQQPSIRRPRTCRAADSDRQAQPGQSAELYTGAVAHHTLASAPAMATIANLTALIRVMSLDALSSQARHRTIERSSRPSPRQRELVLRMARTPMRRRCSTAWRTWEKHSRAHSLSCRRRTRRN